MGMNRASKNDQNFIAFCDELRACVEAHHLFPPKHTTLNNKCCYVRKKINEGKLEEWKVSIQPLFWWFEIY